MRFFISTLKSHDQYQKKESIQKQIRKIKLYQEHRYKHAKMDSFDVKNRLSYIVGRDKIGGGQNECTLGVCSICELVIFTLHHHSISVSSFFTPFPPLAMLHHPSDIHGLPLFLSLYSRPWTSTNCFKCGNWHNFIGFITSSSVILNSCKNSLREMKLSLTECYNQAMFSINENIYEYK